MGIDTTISGILDINDILKDELQKFFVAFKSAGHNIDDYADFDDTGEIESFQFEELEISGGCDAGEEESRYDRHGDPGGPGEPPSVDDICVTIQCHGDAEKKLEITEFLTKKCIDKYQGELLEDAAENERCMREYAEECREEARADMMRDKMENEGQI